jgi:hypothetical protein
LLKFPSHKILFVVVFIIRTVIRFYSLPLPTIREDNFIEIKKKASLNKETLIFLNNRQSKCHHLTFAKANVTE